MSRGYIERRHCPVVAVSELRPQVCGVLSEAGRSANTPPAPARDRPVGEVGVSSATYGSSGDASDPSSCSGPRAGVARSRSSDELFRRGRDGSVLDYLGCRQVSVLPMDAAKSAVAVGVAPTATPKSTPSKAAGLSPSDRKALESTDGNWMLKSEALAEAEKARVRSLHARNIVVSNKLSEAKRAEDRQRRSNGGEVARSPSESPAEGRVARPRQFHSLAARAYGGDHGVRVESCQRPSILARDELGNLFLVPVLDAAGPGGTGPRILSSASSGSSPSPGSAVYPRNEAFVFSVASPHSSSTPDLLQATALSPYVAKASGRAPHDPSSQTLPRKLNEPKHKVRSPDCAPPSADHRYSTMPRSTGGVEDDGKNVYRGAVVRVQVPGHSPKYLKHSQSVDAENSMARRAQYVERRSKSTEHDPSRNVSSSHLKYIDAEVHIDGKTDSTTEKKHKKTRNKSTGALEDNDTRRGSEKSTNRVSRENTPRTVRLQKGRNGFGFVLRGAKSQNQATSTLDFKPTADFPALQYLDRVDHDSVADRAGLKAGDFVLEINGENVVNATHEHTVSLIKNSGDVLDMKVITVKPLTHEVLDQRHIHADGTRTLPYKKKAPKPPIRSPQTFLSHHKKDPVFSSIDDFTVLEGLDRTLARYDTEADRQSLGNASDSFAMNNVPALRGVDQQNKTASISRRIKRLSSTPLEGIFERQGNEDVSIDQSASRQPKPIVVGAQKVYASPQEARIKQNGGLNGSYSHHISHVDVRDGAPENHYSDVSSNIANVHLSSVPDHDKIYHNEHSSDGIYSVPYKHHQQGGLSVKISENSSGGGIPPRPTRPPPQTPPISGGRNVTIPPPPSHAPPATPHSTELGQVVPIQTHQHQYANVSEDIQRQRSGTDSDSSFESSFRPGNKAYVAKEPLGTPGQSTAHSRHSSGTSSLSSSTSNHGEYQLPNVSSSSGPVTAKSSHVVSADVHLSTPARAYEPEPDYDKQETTPKLAHGDIPSLRSLRDAKTTGSAVQTADMSKNNGSVEKTSTEINQTKSASGAAAVMHAKTASNSAEKTKSQQQVTSQKTKAPAPPPPANQPRSSSATPTTSTASTTPTVKQEENVMSAFGNAIKMAALAREKRALEAESGKTKAPAPPPPTSSGSIPPPPPGAPPPPPQITPATSTAAHGSPGLEKKPVPAHVQKQLEETRKREESHAALLAAVAKRRNVVESVDRENLADSIESRIQRSKKLQTVVYKSDQSKPEVKVTTPPAAPVLAKPPELMRSEEKSEGKTPENMANHINNNNVVKANSEEHSTPGHAELSETKSNTDFLAAAEKARQQYLQKKQQATLERKTPTKSPSVGSPAESPRAAADASANGRSPVKLGAGETKNQTTLSDLAHIIAEKALERQRSTGGVLENHNNNNAASAETSSNSSLTLSSDGSLNAVELHGATTDFSHTDTPLSSRTASFSGAKNDDDALLLPVSARKRIFEAKQTASSNKPAAKDYRTNNGLVKAVNKTNLAHRGPDSEGRDNGKIVHNGIAPLDDSRLVNGRADANTDFIPPPPLFDSSAAVDGRTRYVADDSISSMSSVSTLSSADHFDSPPASFSFDIVPPPPPPGFDDSPRTSTTDLTSSTEFIPPPMEFDSPAPPVSPLNGSLKNIQKSNQSHSISYPAMKTLPAGGQKSYQEKDIDKWSTADVASWLDNLQLSEHKDTFVKSKVTGQVLKLMDRNKLISLGVTQVGHRMAIERAIKKATIQ